MPSPYYRDELAKLQKLLNQTLAEHFEADKFSEYPGVGGLAVIASPERWRELDGDRTEISGNIWLIGGYPSLPDCHAGLLLASAQMVKVDGLVREVFDNEIEQFFKPTFQITVDWRLEVEIKQESAKQQAPCTGQIRCPYSMIVPLRSVNLEPPLVRAVG